MDCSPPASVYGILQARILEWVAIPKPEAAIPKPGLEPGFPVLHEFFTIWATREE